MTDLQPLDVWLIFHNRRQQARLRLFCFPYAGGGASIYRTWSTELPPEIEVCRVQLPGRENRVREAPFVRLGPLIETLGPVLYPHLDIPFAFFGHSMGALIGFELTRWLRCHDKLSPMHLFVSGFRAPQVADTDSPIHLSTDEVLIKELQRLNGTPDEVLQNPELRQLLLPLIRADLAICETYIYLDDQPLDCSISAFGGLHDDETNSNDLAAWSAQTSASFTLRLLPGNHFFIHTSEPLLLKGISKDLGYS